MSRAVADEVLRCLFAFIAVVALGGDVGVSFVETVVQAVLICEHMGKSMLRNAHIFLEF